MTRRVAILAGAVAMLILPAPGLHAQSMPAGKNPADLTGPWQLFVDDYLIAARSNVVRTYHPFDKYAGNPVLVGDQPWEGGNIYIYGTVLPGEDGKGYRMWYQTIPRQDELTSVLYATSTDGVRWTKPDLDICDRKGAKDNNVVLPGGFMASVMLRPWELDAQRRYLLMSLGKQGWDASV
jgi:hypothetical protein